MLLLSFKHCWKISSIERPRYNFAGGVLIKSIALAIMLGLWCLPSQAADSLWLLCDDGHLAMNLLEHRSADGQGRVTALRLLLGSNTFVGQLTNTNSGKVLLVGTPKGRNNFNGDIAVDYAKKVIGLKGLLNLNGDRFKVKTQLKCKEMRSNL
jgi:hypothetical protein